MKRSQLATMIENLLRAERAATGFIGWTAYVQTGEAMAHAGAMLLDLRPMEDGATERLDAFLRQIEGVKVVARKIVAPAGGPQ